jgi:hypothetical protein
MLHVILLKMFWLASTHLEPMRFCSVILEEHSHSHNKQSEVVHTSLEREIHDNKHPVMYTILDSNKHKDKIVMH